MEEVQSCFTNGCTATLSKSPSPSSSAATSTSHETHTSPTLCEDSSPHSLESSASTQDTPHHVTNNVIKKHPLMPKPLISHYCNASLKTLTPQISCLAVQNCTLYAASIKEINVFDLNNFSLVETFGSGSGLVKSFAFCGKKTFTGHQDCRIRVWQQVTIKSSGKQKHQLISTIPTFKDRLFNSMLARNYVQIRRHVQKLWIQHADAVSGLAVNNDAGLMYSVSWDKSFKTWKISSDMHCLGSVRAHSDAVNAIVVSPIDRTIYTGSADGLIKAWRALDGGKRHQLLTTTAKHKSSVNALALTQDGLVLYSGGGDQIIFMWKWEDNCENHMVVGCSLKGHRGAILCLMHVNGVLISGSSDRTVRLWKYGRDFGGCCLAVLEGHCKPVKALAAVPGADLEDGDLTVFSGSLDGDIRAWKVMVSDDK